MGAWPQGPWTDPNPGLGSGWLHVGASLPLRAEPGISLTLRQNGRHPISGDPGILRTSAHPRLIWGLLIAHPFLRSCENTQAVCQRAFENTPVKPISAKGGGWMRGERTWTVRGDRAFAGEGPVRPLGLRSSLAPRREPGPPSEDLPCQQMLLSVTPCPCPCTFHPQS